MTNKLKKHFAYGNSTKTTNVLCHRQQYTNPNTKATNLGISPQTTTTTTWNNFENPKNESSRMKHLKLPIATLLYCR